MAYVLDVGEIWTFWENHTIRRFYVDFTLLDTNQFHPTTCLTISQQWTINRKLPWIPNPRSHQETANFAFSGVPIVAEL